MANSSDDQRWNDEWQDAFEGTEVPPSSRVWTGIESGLALREGKKYRKGFLIYRSIAASLLLLLTGSLWYVFVQQRDLDHLTNRQLPVAEEATPSQSGRARSATQEPTETNRTAMPPEPATGSLADGQPDTGRSSSASGSADGARTAGGTKANGVDRTASLPATTDQLAGSSPTTSDAEQAKALPATDPISSRDASVSFQNTPKDRSLVPLAGRTTTTEPPATLAKTAGALVSRVAARSATAPPFPTLAFSDTESLYRVPQPQTTPTREKPDRSFFAGLSLAPGYFDPQFEAPGINSDILALGAPAAAPGMLGQSGAVVTNQFSSPTTNADHEQELSFSYGVDLGMRLSEHWSVESGVDYNRFSTTSAARWAVVDVANGVRYPYVNTNSQALDAQLDARAASVVETNVSNAYEFIAVPLKLGYSLSIDRMLFTLSSGVAANFFLNNNISASQESFESYQLSASDTGSPFKPVYYSGVLSGGINYNVLGSYFISLVPSYSFAITSLTRERSELNSQPRTFGMNVGIRYQF